MTIRRALLSVSDKTGLEDFANCLEVAGVEIVSTGGTARLLREAGIQVTDVAVVTGFPEIMDGRLKTLHPKIHGGLLAKRGNEGHLAAMETEAIEGIDLLVVNLYPFEATLAPNNTKQVSKAVNTELDSRADEMSSTKCARVVNRVYSTIVLSTL